MEQKSFASVIGLNVGGKKFTTRLTTLQKYPDSMLAAMFSGRHNLDQDMDGNYFIDRNGRNFYHILEFMRDEQYFPPEKVHREVLKEAEYFGITQLVDKIKQLPKMQITLALSQDNIKLRRYLLIREKVIRLAVANATKHLTPQCTSQSSVLLFTYKKAPSWHKSFPNTSANSFNEFVTMMVGASYKDTAIEIFIDDGQVFDCESFFYQFLKDLQSEGYNVAYKEFRSPGPTVMFENTGYMLSYGKVFSFDWNFVPHIYSNNNKVLCPNKI